MHPVRIGIGGWVYAPWRTTFYPPGMRPADWLGHASRQLTSIEINATFHRTQNEASFRDWRATAPDGFVFAVKGPRWATQTRDTEKAAEAVARFLGSGVTGLGEKLGPVLWQFPAARKFDPDELGRFLALLPAERDGCRLRHAIEAQHATFDAPDCATLLRRHNMARVLVHDGKEVQEVATADFAYARLKGSVSEEPAGYAPAALDRWARRILAWARRQDCFVYVIAGAKERAPAAAMGLIERVNARK